MQLIEFIEFMTRKVRTLQTEFTVLTVVGRLRQASVQGLGFKSLELRV